MHLHVHVEEQQVALHRRADHLELPGRGQLGVVLGRQADRDVDVALLEQRPAGARRGDLAEHDLLELGEGPRLPLVEAGEDELVAGLPALHLEGAAAGVVALGPLDRVGVGGGRVLQRQLLS